MVKGYICLSIAEKKWRSNSFSDSCLFASIRGSFLFICVYQHLSAAELLWLTAEC